MVTVRKRGKERYEREGEERGVNAVRAAEHFQCFDCRCVIEVVIIATS